jgi:hypothetical protein
VTQATKHGHEKVAQAVHLTVQYSAALNSVSLILVGSPRFARGGQLIVNAAAPDGIIGTSGAYLAGSGETAGEDGVFTILPGGKALVNKA